MLACTQGAGRVAPWGRGACEGRIVARGRARDTRSRVDSDMRVRNEGQLVPCAIDFGATNRPERPLLGGMTRWREVRTMHSTSGRYNERGTRRSGSSPKVSPLRRRFLLCMHLRPMSHRVAFNAVRDGSGGLGAAAARVRRAGKRRSHHAPSETNTSEQTVFTLRFHAFKSSC